MWRAQPESTNDKNAFLVFIHGDGQGSLKADVYQALMQRYANALGVTSILLQRPGYNSQLGVSDGLRTLRDDDFTPDNMARLAKALAHLRRVYPDKKILLAGHSGGSAHTALIAGRFPGSADAYLMIACPCDIAPWREWRRVSAGRAGTWSSLSPLSEVDRVPVQTVMQLVVGSKDDNTLPLFSERYAQAQTARGMKITVNLADGATHGSVLRSPELLDVMARMLAVLHSK